MKKFVLSVAAAILSVTPVLAADMPVKAPKVVPEPSPWDWAFGAALMSDYNFRGISQSNKGPSVTAYSETRYNVNSNWQLYAGQQYWAVTLPTNPTCECDIYAGIRPTVGPLAFDFGAIYYWYPKERQHATGAIPAAPFPTYPNGNLTLRDTDYYEGYGKVTWEAIKDKLWFGANEYYSPDWLNTGAYGNYASLTAKVGLPSFNVPLFGLGEIGAYVSGELGHYWLGTTKFVPGTAAVGGVLFPVVNLPDYTTWNAGLAFTWKVGTIDFRYYDTNLSKVNCNALTGDPNALVTAVGVQSKWCGATFIAKSSFDITLANLK
jgi:uncharacterized protein (TIGR02001 family)